MAGDPNGVPGQQLAIINAAAQHAGIDPAVLYGVYGTETSFGKDLSTSSAGAIGPFQFEPNTAQSMGVNPNDFRSAAFGAARYLAQFKGRGTAGMLSAYNAGPAGGLQQGYVNKVLSYAKQFPGSRGGSATGGRQQAQGGTYLAGVPGTPGQPAVPAVDNTNDALISALLNTGKVEDLTKTTGKIGGGLLSSASGILDQLNSENPPTAGSPAVPATPGTRGMYLGGSGGSGSNGNAVARGGGTYGALVGGKATFAGPDQGLDFTGAGPIFAPDNIHIVSVNRGSGWPGEHTLIVGQLTSGPQRGRYVYFAEDINPGSLKPGDTIAKGHQLAYATGSGRAPGIEVGFAQNAAGQAYGNIHEGKGSNAPDPQAVAFQHYVTFGMSH